MKQTQTTCPICGAVAWHVEANGWHSAWCEGPDNHRAGWECE